MAVHLVCILDGRQTLLSVSMQSYQYVHVQCLCVCVRSCQAYLPHSFFPKFKFIFFIALVVLQRAETHLRLHNKLIIRFPAKLLNDKMLGLVGNMRPDNGKLNMYPRFNLNSSYLSFDFEASVE